MARAADHDRRVQREFERQAESFAASGTLGGGPLITSITRNLADAGHGRVLDLAAGPGLLAAALAGQARQVVALDLTAATLRVARERLSTQGHANVSLVRGNGMRLPLRSGGFDAAVIRLALHHLEDPASVLREAHRALRPGGTLAVLDLAAPEDRRDQALLTAIEQLRDPSHVRALTASELVQTLRDTGFEPSHEESFELERRFREWAAIIADPVRTDALRVVMHELADRGVRAGVALREQDGELLFDYRFSLVLGRRP